MENNNTNAALTFTGITKLIRTADTLRTQSKARGIAAERKAELVSLAMVAEAAAYPHLVTAMRSAQWIVCSSSAGKDSQVMLHTIVALADANDISRDKIVVVHSDLGRVEWEGTKELCERQAKSYGVRFEIVSRIGQVAAGRGAIYAKGETFGDLLDYTERRAQNLKDQGKPAPSWPSNSNRFCTSEFKRGPISAFFTKLARESKAAGHKGAAVILDLQGLRAEESVARAKKPTCSLRKDSANQLVLTWLPIIDMTERQVWDTIKSNGLEYHRAYDLGMPRLSCAFCIFASKDALMVAGIANPELLNEYVAVEERTGYSFKQDLALADIKVAIANGEQPNTAKLSWAQCA